MCAVRRQVSPIMDIPQPPDGKNVINCIKQTYIFMLVLDHELRIIIDKLAVFVARNGPEFEQMTKTKQKENPKFEFLFGGRHFDYYLYKVTSEQAST